MTESEKTILYSAAQEELTESLKKFIQERYHHNPKLKTKFQPHLIFPIVVSIEEEDSESYINFFNKVDEDLDRLRDRHFGTSFEFGEKLLRLMLNHEIIQYHFEPNTVHIYMREEEGLDFVLRKEYYVIFN
jgi:hypothetical protein